MEKLETNEFIKRLNKVIKKSFVKIRITDKKDKDLEALFERRKILRSKNYEKSIFDKRRN